MKEKKEELGKELNLQIERRKDIKDSVEEKIDKLNDEEGVSTLGSLKLEGDIKGYLRRNRMEKR